MSAESVQSFATARRVAHGRANALNVPHWIRRTLKQVLYITPLFWFMELFQNWIYKEVTGQYGWGYPDAAGALRDATVPLAWYSLKSVPLWGLTVVVFSTLEPIFVKHKLSFLWRMAIAGGIGWAGEWTAGFLSTRVLHEYLQVWHDTKLIYISVSVLPFWCLNFLFFHLLTKELRVAHESRSAKRE